MLKIVEILHHPLQRIKEVLLDIAIDVKMANLRAAITVLSVSLLTIALLKVSNCLYIDDSFTREPFYSCDNSLY
jgi:hypothetical protein